MKKILFFTTFTLLLVAAMSDTASADTYVSGPNNDIYTTVNINTSVYSPNELIRVTTSISSLSPQQVNVSLTAGTASNPTATVIAAQSIAYGAALYGTLSLTAPNAAGSYAVNFVTGVDTPSALPATPTIAGVYVYSVCYNNNDCDIQGDAGLDMPAGAAGASFDVVFKYSLCSTGGGCSQAVQTGTTSVSLSPGQDTVHLGIMGTPGAEPQIQSYCVDASTSTVTVPNSMKCQ